jgi:D-beta-D-heptose 7-phosphate kinase/D-beta-D-heptose 1-phosphate adenosyltransferase
MGSKIKKTGEIRKIAASLRKKKRRIVFTNGCFDILHYGHIKYLEKCRRLGDVLIIGLNSDSSVKKVKGKGRPVTGEKERAAILSALEFVDYITIFGAKTPKTLIEEITPDVLAKGGDWRKRDIVGREHVEKHGGRVASIPFVKGYSTTNILARIKNA